MKNFGKWALCMFVCLAAVGFLAQSALADSGWGDPAQKGKPALNPHESVGPSYCGQPLMLDAFPWIDGPPQKGKLDPVIPTMSPCAWWQQPALDDRPWQDEDPPRKNRPEF